MYAKSIKRSMPNISITTACTLHVTHTKKNAYAAQEAYKKPGFASHEHTNTQQKIEGESPRHQGGVGLSCLFILLSLFVVDALCVLDIRTLNNEPWNAERNDWPMWIILCGVFDVYGYCSHVRCVSISGDRRSVCALLFALQWWLVNCRAFHIFLCVWRTPWYVVCEF